MAAKHPFPVKVLLFVALCVSVLQIPDDFVGGLSFHDMFWEIMAGLLVSGMGIAWYMQKIERKGRDTTKLFIWVQTYVRYYVCFFICMYAAAKFLQTQFTTPEVVRDTPIGELSGFQLTWFYYGYARPVGLIVGSLQLLGGTLLLFRRTALLGALLLLPVLTNIVIINIYYNIDFGAAINSVLYTFFCLYIIWYHADWIIEAVRKHFRESPGIFSKQTPAGKTLLNLTRAMMVVGPFIILYMLKQEYVFAKGPLDGVWQVVSYSVNGKEVVKEPEVYPNRFYFTDAENLHFMIDKQVYWARLQTDTAVQSLSINYYDGQQGQTMAGQFTKNDSLMEFTTLQGQDTVHYHLEYVRAPAWGY